VVCVAVFVFALAFAKTNKQTNKKNPQTIIKVINIEQKNNKNISL